MKNLVTSACSDNRQVSFEKYGHLQNIFFFTLKMFARISNRLEHSSIYFFNHFDFFFVSEKVKPEAFLYFFLL